MLKNLLEQIKNNKPNDLEEYIILILLNYKICKYFKSNLHILNILCSNPSIIIDDINYIIKDFYFIEENNYISKLNESINEDLVKYIFVIMIYLNNKVKEYRKLSDNIKDYESIINKDFNNIINYIKGILLSLEKN